MQSEGAGGKGHRGAGRKRESALFFLPSSERVAIDTVHLIKICAPPSLTLSLVHRQLPLLLWPFKLKCSPLLDGEKERQTERRDSEGRRVDGGNRDPGHMPPPLGLERLCRDRHCVPLTAHKLSFYYSQCKKNK